MSEQLDAHAVLVRARNLIGARGWRQDPSTYPEGSRCLVMAVKDIDLRHYAGQEVEALDAISRANRLPYGGRELGRWNDAPGRTKAEVLAAFDRAIAATAPAPADPFDGQDVEVLAAGGEAVGPSLEGVSSPVRGVVS